MQRGKCVDCMEIVAEMGIESQPGKFLVSMQSMSEQCPRSTDGFHHLSEEENSMTEQQTERPEITARPAVMPGGTVHEGGVPAPAQQGGQQVTPGADPALIASIVQQTLGTLMSEAGGPGAPQTFEEALNDVDPRDSEAALAMLDWLLRNKRLNRVGTLDGGQGYLFVYQEPKGTSKEGYVPGGTQGDRIVDQAVEKQREAGVTPRGRSTMCRKCFSAVIVDGEGNVLTDDATANAECSEGGTHDPA